MQTVAAQVTTPDDIAVEAQTFLAALDTALNAQKKGEITLDVADISHVGAASVQVLVFAAQMCAGHGVRCHLGNASDLLIAALSDCGVSHLFVDREEK